MENNTYKTLEEIQQRKRMLSAEIASNEKSMRKLWDTLFHSEDTHTIPTPSRRLSKILTTGAGVVDGALLGWKLYRRFKK